MYNLTGLLLLSHLASALTRGPWHRPGRGPKPLANHYEFHPPPSVKSFTNHGECHPSSAHSRLAYRWFRRRLEAVKIRRLGYPRNMSHDDFRLQFERLLHPALASATRPLFILVWRIDGLEGVFVNTHECSAPSTEWRPGRTFSDYKQTVIWGHMILLNRNYCCEQKYKIVNRSFCHCVPSCRKNV